MTAYEYIAGIKAYAAKELKETPESIDPISFGFNGRWFTVSRESARRLAVNEGKIC